MIDTSLLSLLSRLTNGCLLRVRAEDTRIVGHSTPSCNIALLILQTLAKVIQSTPQVCRTASRGQDEVLDNMGATKVERYAVPIE